MPDFEPDGHNYAMDAELHLIESAISADVRKCGECGIVIGHMTGEGLNSKMELDPAVATKIGAPEGKRGYWCDTCAGRK